MTDLYLIAHRVRGEPAFDVAQRIHCPECNPHGDQWKGCHECDGRGIWWIIPTSGHRAYPYWHSKLTDIGGCDCCGHGGFYHDSGILEAMPDELQDHYLTQAEPTRSLTDLLNLRPKPVAPILRRI